MRILLLLALFGLMDLAHAQAPDPAEARLAVKAVLKQNVILDKDAMPRKLTPLPMTGTWSRLPGVPDTCPSASALPCMRIAYRVAESGIDCEWTVQMTTADPVILDQNEDASTYMRRRMTPDQAKGLIASRGSLRVPPIAEAAHASGKVTFKVLVDRTGNATYQQVSQTGVSCFGLGQAATLWSFQPLLVNGRAVPYELVATIDFTSSGPGTGQVTAIP